MSTYLKKNLIQVKVYKLCKWSNLNKGKGVGAWYNGQIFGLFWNCLQSACHFNNHIW
jgi:hypothetical protein